MTPLFADTSFLIAILNRHDQLHDRATEMRDRLTPFRLLTSEMVLVEVLNDFSRKHRGLRASATQFIADLRRRSTEAAAFITIVPQTSELFDAAFSLYRQRSDKQWSMTDCASCIIMQQHGVGEALTHDQHFQQMGVKPLLRSDA